MDKPKRDFHPGYAKRPNGCHHAPFTWKMWQRWLARLNEEPDESLVQGIQQMRAMLEQRHRVELVDEVIELRARIPQLEAEIGQLEADLNHCVEGT